ncbi:hypothetical protein HPP92_020609 [Vanilla planifolia]|uniref:UBP-type domain-containing protein n=1 Tax=Vanilla planifolia TaxID=51239 RepID=A0A835Q1L0_VANPL|nr:hypothetical protein HPP92_020609 [Vanilla planifolia]
MASKRSPGLTSPNPCRHLSNYRERYGLSGYRSLQKSLRLSPSGRTTLGRQQSTIPRCNSCTETALGRLYFCLICSSISCPSHSAAHPISSPGHDIAIDIERAELFCLSCADQVYDPDFDSAVVASAATIPYSPPADKASSAAGTVIFTTAGTFGVPGTLECFEASFRA